MAIDKRYSSIVDRGDNSLSLRPLQQKITLCLEYLHVLVLEELVNPCFKSSSSQVVKDAVLWMRPSVYSVWGFVVRLRVSRLSFGRVGTVWFSLGRKEGCWHSLTLSGGGRLFLAVLRLDVPVSHCWGCGVAPRGWWWQGVRGRASGIIHDLWGD